MGRACQDLVYPRLGDMRGIVVFVFLGFLATSAAGAGVQPSLRIVSKSPLVVSGVSFVPNERVAVTALTGLGPRTTRTVAVGGRFRVALRVQSKGCGAAFAVRAIGGSGSRALIRMDSVGVCVPPPRD